MLVTPFVKLCSGRFFGGDFFAVPLTDQLGLVITRCFSCLVWRSRGCTKSIEIGLLIFILNSFKKARSGMQEGSRSRHQSNAFIVSLKLTTA
jgi:hypothetical protein